MTPQQIELVKTSWAMVSGNADTVAALFYNKLFELDPSLRSLFKGNMKEQGKKLTLLLNIVVTQLDELDNLVPRIETLGQRHHRYGVQEAHFNTVGAALLWTLDQGLGPAFTPAVKGAWAHAYTVLASTMKSAMRTEFASRVTKELPIAV